MTHPHEKLALNAQWIGGGKFLLYLIIESALWYFFDFTIIGTMFTSLFHIMGKLLIIIACLLGLFLYSEIPHFTFLKKLFGPAWRKARQDAREEMAAREKAANSNQQKQQRQQQQTQAKLDAYALQAAQNVLHTLLGNTNGNMILKLPRKRLENMLRDIASQQVNDPTLIPFIVEDCLKILSEKHGYNKPQANA